VKRGNVALLSITCCDRIRYDTIQCHRSHRMPVIPFLRVLGQWMSGSDCTSSATTHCSHTWEDGSRVVASRLVGSVVTTNIPHRRTSKRSGIVAGRLFGIFVVPDACVSLSISSFFNKTPPYRENNNFSVNRCAFCYDTFISKDAMEAN
jgi:hypothetical protein